MPFGTCTWVNGTPRVDFNEIPKPELRHELRKWFTLLRSFCYLVPNEDPASGKIFVIPGADAPSNTESRSFPGEAGRVIVVPPTFDGRTDIASVPSFMWWLVASYGNHTRAALLHDALIPEEGAPPVARTAADRLMLSALREPGQQKRGAFRHWVMWAAVSVFGTMRPPLWLRSIGVVVHVYATWILLIAALAFLLGDEVRLGNWKHVALTLAAVPIFLVLIGSSWRAGANRTAGWLPTVLLLAPVLVLLGIAMSGWDSSQSAAFWLLLAVVTLSLLGHVWGFAVDRTLRWRLWPTALVGLPIAGIPVFLILLSVTLVWLVDLGASVAASASEDQPGRRRGFELPAFEPYKTPF